MLNGSVSYSSMLNVMLLTGCLPGPGTILGRVADVSWFLRYVQLNWEERKANIKMEQKLETEQTVQTRTIRRRRGLDETKEKKMEKLQNGKQQVRFIKHRHHGKTAGAR